MSLENEKNILTELKGIKKAMEHHYTIVFLLFLVSVICLVVLIGLSIQLTAESRKQNRPDEVVECAFEPKIFKHDGTIYVCTEHGTFTKQLTEILDTEEIR